MGKGYGKELGYLHAGEAFVGVVCAGIYHSRNEERDDEEDVGAVGVDVLIQEVGNGRTGVGGF